MSKSLPPAVVISIALTLLWIDWAQGLLAILFLFAAGGIAVHIALTAILLRRHLRDLAKGLRRLPTASILDTRSHLLHTLHRHEPD